MSEELVEYFNKQPRLGTLSTADVTFEIQESGRWRILDRGGRNLYKSVWSKNWLGYHRVLPDVQVSQSKENPLRDYGRNWDFTSQSGEHVKVA